MAHSQQIEIARAAEVEIAVLQAQVFVDFVGAFVVEREGQRFADILGRDLRCRFLAWPLFRKSVLRFRP